MQTHRGDEVRRSPLEWVSCHRVLISNGEAAPQKAYNRMSARILITITDIMLFGETDGGGHDVQNKL